jgi:hypothetical protein
MLWHAKRAYLPMPASPQVQPPRSSVNSAGPVRGRTLLIAFCTPLKSRVASNRGKRPGLVPKPRIPDLEKTVIPGGDPLSNQIWRASKSPVSFFMGVDRGR